MMSLLSSARASSPSTWQMPITPDDYDQRPFSSEECQAIEHMKNVSSYAHGVFNPSSRESRAAKSMLTRLSQPFTDIFHLRYQGRMEERCSGVHLMMYREMARHGKFFWNWSLNEWMDTICPNRMLFYEKHGPMPGCRMSIMDMAYLFGGVTDLRVMGMRAEMVETAQAYFGKTLIMEQCQRVHEAKRYAISIMLMRQPGIGPCFS